MTQLSLLNYVPTDEEVTPPHVAPHPVNRRAIAFQQAIADLHWGLILKYTASRLPPEVIRNLVKRSHQAREEAIAQIKERR